MVTRLDRAYEVEVHQLRLRVTNFAMRFWNSMGSWRDADIERLLATVTPQVLSGQQRIADLTDAYLTRLAQQQGFAVKGRPFQATTEALRGVADGELYRRPFASMRNTLANGGTVTNAVAVGKDRLRSIVETNMQLAKTHAGQRALESSGVQMTERVLTGRENCALCVIASTQRYWARELQPIHPGCVPGDSVLVAGTGGSTKLADFAWGEVQAVSRRLFEGELIEFVTSSGDEVRVTANHPVLTDQGWVPAHLLGEGYTVFRSGRGERVVLGSPDVNERPALAQDVFDSARVAFPLVRVPLAAEDFHADRAEGEVEIVYTYGHFPTPGSESQIEIARELSFVDGHGGRLALDGLGALGTLVPGGFPSFGGGVGGGGLRGDLFCGHLGGAELSGSAPGARFDAPAEEFGPESIAAYRSRGRDLVSRLSGEVEGDRIVKLRRVSWSGHVFNLHTREGWYSSNNHIVSNCDCGQRPWFGDPDEQIIHPDRLDAIHTAVESQFGTGDRGARLIDGKNSISDYLDLITVREHGELGPVLAWRSERFTSASDIESQGHNLGR